MPLYKSEDDKCRLLVSRLYFNEDRELKDSSLGSLLDEAYKAHEEILACSKLGVIDAVLDRDTYLAIWKGTSQKSEWHRFIAHLEARGVSTRNINKVKQIVEEAFLVLMADAIEMEKEDVYEITGVKDVQVVQGAKGLTVRIWYL